MGVRGELFSTKVSLQNRTYFFNVKENRLGDLYLNVVESKNRDEGGFERQSVILFAEDLQEFLKGFDESLRVLEKAVREKRRGGRNPAGDKPGEAGGRRSSAEDSGERNSGASSRQGHASSRGPRHDRESGEGKNDGKRRFKPRTERERKEDGPARGRQGNKERSGEAPRKKRVVVKKG